MFGNKEGSMDIMVLGSRLTFFTPIDSISISSVQFPGGREAFVSLVYLYKGLAPEISPFINNNCSVQEQTPVP